MTLSFIGFVIVNVGFIALLWHMKSNAQLLLAVSIYMGLNAVLFIGYTLAIRKKMNTILHKLSETIQSLTHMQDHIAFSTVEDTMLSKLQSQIIQLSHNLKAQNKRHREDGEAIKLLISDISHQLKTPLTNLNMYNSLLLNTELTLAKREEFTQVMASELKRLNWLMGSLITMSRLEAGMIRLHMEEQCIENTVLMAIKQIYPKASERQVEIQLQGDPKLIIRHDVRWTGEAIFNLLDNAVKYTEPRGIVQIIIQKYELFARIDVIDQGIGITEQEINLIFGRFYRGNNVRQMEGVGIGLYLVRKIVHQQGGYVKVKSVTGKGSTFSVFLPL